MYATLALPPPAIEQPAPRQVSYGLVTGIAARGTRRIVVSAEGRVLADEPLRGRRFTLRVTLPTGDVAVRVTTISAGSRRSARVVRDVLALPPTARPRFVGSREDPALARRVRGLAQSYRGTSGIYIQSLTGGGGTAWNAKARFPAASTLKLAIATAVLAEYSGVPVPGSRMDALLRQTITLSDNASANALEIWLAGSTSAGSGQVNALMRAVGLRDTIMYGGYEIGTYARRIPVRVEDQPAFGFGKYTTAWDLSTLLRAVWLASGGRGPLHSARSGFTAADGRYLLWLIGHVRDTPKLDRVIGRRGDTVVLHKAGWIDAARHDAGLVFWRGGVFVVSVMTWSASGAGLASDVLAGRCAAVALERFRGLHG